MAGKRFGQQDLTNFLVKSDMQKQDWLERLQQDPEKYQQFMSLLQGKGVESYGGSQITQQPSIFNKLGDGGQEPQPLVQPASVLTPQPATPTTPVSSVAAQTKVPRSNYPGYNERAVNTLPQAQQESLPTVQIKPSYSPERIAELNEQQGAIGRFWTGNLTENGDYVGGYGNMISAGANLGLGIYGAYNAGKQVDLMEDSLNYQKKVDATNLWNQGTQYNEHQRWKQGLQNHMSGLSEAEAAKTFESDEYKKKLAKKVI